MGWQLRLHLLVIAATSAIGVLGQLPTIVGCFSSAVPLVSQGTYKYQSSGYCNVLCQKKNETVLGLSAGTTCWCGDELPSGSSRVADSFCNTVCQGYGLEDCGGSSNGVTYFTVWLTGLSANVPSYSGSSTSSSSSSSSTSSSSRTSTASSASSTSSTTSTSTTSSSSSTSPSAIAGSQSGTRQSNHQRGDQILAIVLGVVIGFIAVALAAALFFWVHRRNKKNQRPSSHKTPLITPNRNSFQGDEDHAGEAGEKEISPIAGAGTAAAGTAAAGTAAAGTAAAGTAAAGTAAAGSTIARNTADTTTITSPTTETTTTTTTNRAGTTTTTTENGIPILNIQHPTPTRSPERTRSSGILTPTGLTREITGSQPVSARKPVPQPITQSRSTGLTALPVFGSDTSSLYSNASSVDAPFYTPAEQRSDVQVDQSDLAELKQMINETGRAPGEDARPGSHGEDLGLPIQGPRVGEQQAPHVPLEGRATGNGARPESSVLGGRSNWYGRESVDGRGELP